MTKKVRASVLLATVVNLKSAQVAKPITGWPEKRGPIGIRDRRHEI